MKMFLIALIFLIAMGVFYAARVRNTPKAVVVVEGKSRYYVDIARDAVTQARGLSGREKMAEAEGVLFVFTQPLPRSFWMNDMNFPLDFMWIRDMRIIGIAENVPHPAANNGEVFRLSSPEPADMVLEVNAGQIKAQGIKVGDTIKLEEPKLDTRG